MTKPALGGSTAADDEERVARVVGGTFTSVEARRRMATSDYEGEYASVGGRPYHSRIRGLDAAGIRIARIDDRGAVWMRIAWRPDTLAAAFMWGEQTRVEKTAFRVPRLGIPGPGTEVATWQDGPSHTLRLGIRGTALQALRADARTERILASFLRPGVHLPAVSPRAEWRLQQHMLRASRFADDLAAKGIDAPEALTVAAREVLAQFLALLEEVRPEPCAPTKRSQRQLLDDAVAILEADPEVPVSVAEVCHRLGVSERTLQRLFKARFGVGPRDYERHRRLRHVHATILAEGDRRMVTEIAMQYGFWHLGRFAGAYAATFGCPPSETRRRAWARTADLAASLSGKG
ncbi:MAG: helix-turn-helix transcriptional regulator [Roseicyclus sp.]